MKHITEFVSTCDTAVTIGKFDGFHLGHMKLFDSVKMYAAANGLKTAAISFKPHPAEALGVSGEYKTIFTSEEKKFILEEIGMDIYLEYPFTAEFAGTSPQAFAEEMLFKSFKCKYIAVGEGYRFGKNQEGTGDLLIALAEKYGAYIDIVHNARLDGNIISSSLVRQHIQECEFEKAQKLMYKPFYVSGIVVHGKKIGRTIGVPTVNILPEKRKLLPPDGVYLTRINIDNLSINGVTNVGTNPTVSEAGGRTVETHMLDCDRNLYGEYIKVIFMKRLRDVVKFNGISELREQIVEDIKKARGLI